ncbi:MAG: EpsG family protein [Fusobacteriaceae bacterium]
MTIYWTIGILLLTGSIFDIFTKSKKKELVYYVLIGGIAIVFMTRYLVGWDWHNYSNDFYNLNFEYEKGYRLFVLLVNKIYSNFNFFIGLNTFIDFIMIGWVLRKYSPYPIFSLFLYLGISGLSLEVDLLRNVKSIFLFLISLKSLKEKKIYVFLFLNILGMTFHITSIIYVFLYFLINRNWNKKIVFGVFTLGIIYYFSDYTLIVEFFKKINFIQIDSYLELIPKNKINGISIFFIERILFFTIIFSSSYFIKRNDINQNIVKENQGNLFLIFENSSYIYIFLFLFCSELSVITFRLSLLFVFAYWFIFPIIMSYSTTRIKIFIFVLALSFIGVKNWNFFTFKGNQIVYEYENIFFKHKSYEEKIERLKLALKYKDEGQSRELLILY